AASPNSSAAPTSGAAPTQGTPAPTAPADGAAPVRVVSVPDITLSKLKISAEDRQVSPAPGLALGDLNGHVVGFPTSRSSPLAVTLDTKINQQGKLEVKADLPPDFSSAKAHVELANFNLTALQPYITQKTAMTLTNGLLATKLDVDRAADTQVTVAGE